MTRRTFSGAMAASMIFAQESEKVLEAGHRLPPLRGEYLTGRRARLPEDAAGKAALLLIGFSYQSRFDVEAWAKRFRDEFGKDSRITFYEVPMIGGMARMGKWFIDSGMRRGTPKENHENVITVYGGTEPWKKRLAVKNEETAHVVLIDGKGNVAWLHGGPPEDSAYQSLAGQIQKLMDGGL